MAFPELDACCGRLSSGNREILQECQSTIERFVVLMYDRSSESTSVNECRRLLYTKRNRAIENVPPTADALLQHTKRAALQAHIWTTCLDAVGNQCSPSDWGWKEEDGVFQPVWCTQPEVSKHCRQLVACSCKRGCRGLCKCKRNQLSCSQLCQCEGLCSGSVYNVAVDEGEEQEVQDEHEVHSDAEIVFQCHDESCDGDIYFSDSESEVNIQSEVP